MKINRQFTLVLLGSVLFFAVVSTMASIKRSASCRSMPPIASDHDERVRRIHDAGSGDRVRGGGPRRLAARAGRRGRLARWDEYVASSSTLPDLGFALVVDGEGRQLSATDEVRDASAAFVRHIDAAKDAGVRPSALWTSSI